MSNSKSKAAEEQQHNKQYFAEKKKLSEMSVDEILQEKITNSVSKAVSELMPQAHKMLIGK